jgi:hypothetical protein
VVGGTGAALGFILRWEMLNRSIRRPIELSQHLGIQPIATIPYIRTPGQRRWKRRVLVLVLALIVIGIPLVLLAVQTYYGPLDQVFGEFLASIGG